ncbi:MAG: HDOD domain-containing protein [Planctomycetes bacterium]|nr:HDOD domain-containing protein [Planctomycetota bacterium]
MTVKDYTNLGEEVMSRLRGLNDLPSLPIVIMRLTEILQDEDSSAQQVSRIMEDDPAIMARVIKVVNSAFYSGAFASKPVTHVRHAIVRLGFDAIRNIALTTSVFSVFKEDHKQIFNRNEFWRHCICTGIIANVLYRFCKKSDIRIPVESMFLGGLLHDMGKIVMEQYFHDLFTEVLRYGERKKVPLFMIEEQVLSLTHAQIGAWLARRWKLSEDLITCIEHHHKPENAPPVYRAMAGIVHVADYICNLKALGQSGNTVPPPFNQSVWGELGLEITMISDIMDIVDVEAKKSEILLSLKGS